jgi:hypothetical protein
MGHSARRRRRRWRRLRRELRSVIHAGDQSAEVDPDIILTEDGATLVVGDG